MKKNPLDLRGPVTYTEIHYQSFGEDFSRFVIEQDGETLHHCDSLLEVKTWVAENVPPDILVYQKSANVIEPELTEPAIITHYACIGMDYGILSRDYEIGKRIFVSTPDEYSSTTTFNPLDDPYWFYHMVSTLDIEFRFSRKYIEAWSSVYNIPIVKVDFTANQKEEALLKAVTLVAARYGLQRQKSLDDLDAKFDNTLISN